MKEARGKQSAEGGGLSRAGSIIDGAAVVFAVGVAQVT